MFDMKRAGPAAEMVEGPPPTQVAKSRSTVARERRAHPVGGASLQMRAVDGPRVPLPPFGRRAGDIAPVAPRHLVVRRVLDVTIAGTALIILLPVFAGLAAGVKITSRGPVLFRQNRIGRDGVPFALLKFRSMRVGTSAEIDSCEAARAHFVSSGFKLDRKDPRITRLGRVMRRTSLDELPQLINVLRGEMSVVGVRAVVAEELAMRPAIDQVLYTRLRPGLTGLWQVSGRSSITLNQRVAMDRRYAAEWHPVDDVKILLRTPISLLRTDQAA